MDFVYGMMDLSERRRAMKLYRIIKWVMTAGAVLLLPAMYLVPALAERRGLFSWMLYGLYILVVLFVWGAAGKGNRNVSRGFDPEADNQTLDETREIIRERSRWKGI